MTKVSTRECWRDRRLWPHGNNTFVSAPEPLIFIYANPGVLLALRTGAGGTFINNQFSNPEAAVRKCLRLFQRRCSTFATFAPPKISNLNRSSNGEQRVSCFDH
jgi:hypothetical protein